jgi:class 3 adenylate cyclase/tetratricopeptide (TPR) repeat protein
MPDLPRPPQLPSGTVTFLFTDIEGSTHLLQALGADYATALADHHRLLRQAWAERQGVEIDTAGDGLFVAFATAPQAVAAAVQAQRALAAHTWPESGSVRARMGLHTGTPQLSGDRYVGLDVHRAARIMAAGHGGQVLLSQTTHDLVEHALPDGVTLRDLGAHQLKDLQHREQLWQLVMPGLPADFPPLKTLDAYLNNLPTQPTALPVGGFLGAAPDPEEPLVARDSEVQQLQAALDAVASGSARLVLLSGEPGVGKTRLAQEVMVAARSRDFLVATGRCYEPQQAVPYYPILEALRHAYAQAPMAMRSELATRWPDVARLLPDQVGAWERSSAGGAGMGMGTGMGTERSDDQQRLFWQVTSFLQALAAARPVALLLDDLHWADSASLALVQHLARHTRADRVLVLGTYRDVEINRQHPLEAALRDLMREQVLERLAVRRLPAEGTHALIRATLHTNDVSPAFSELLHQRAEGNPFFIRELLHALIEQGDVYRDASGAWSRHSIEEIAVPESVRSVIGQRLTRLAEATQTVLLEASVLGQTFSFAHLQAMSGQGEQALEGALDEAMAAGLVRETREMRGVNPEKDWIFSHALVQQTLYAELSSRRKRRLHRAAGEAIEGWPEREPRSAELAWHFLEADEPARALPYVLQAGDQAERVYAHAEAGQQFGVAAALAHDLDDRAREAEALEKLGKTYHLRSRYQDAVDAYERALALCDTLGDAERTTRALSHFVELCAVRGEAQHALTRATPVLDMLRMLPQQPASPAIVRLYWSLTMLYLGENDLTAALDASEKAVAAASAGTDSLSVVHATYWRGCALIAIDRLAEGFGIMEEVIPLAEAARDLLVLSYALQFVGNARERAGDLRASRSYYDRALEVAERLGEPVVIAVRLSRRGSGWLLAGEWERAQVDFERAVALLRQAETARFGFSSGFLRLATLRLLQGKRDEADTLFAQGLQVSSRNDRRTVDQVVGLILAERDLLDGRPQEAVARLEPLLDAPGREEVDVTLLLGVMAWALCDVGDVARAMDVIGQAIRWAIDEPNAPTLVDARWIQGVIFARQRRWPAAEAALEQAIQMARDLPYPYAEAKALYVYGQMRAEQGDSAQARERFEAGLTICAQLGERLYAEKIEEELAKLGAAPASARQMEAP